MESVIYRPKKREYVSKSSLILDANKTNFRGWSTLDLIIELQCTQDKFTAIKECRVLFNDRPDEDIHEHLGHYDGHAAYWRLGFAPISMSRDKYLDMQEYYHRCYSKSIIEEIKRRSRFKSDTTGKPPVGEIIEAIKQSIDLSEVISWYTDVIPKGKTITFRCPLHSDTHPSGIIYLDERRWHCFQCSEHGDAIDAVQKFGKLDIGPALLKLSQYCGIEIRPLEQPKLPVKEYQSKKPGRELRGIQI